MLLYKCIFLLVLHDDCPNAVFLENLRNRCAFSDSANRYGYAIVYEKKSDECGNERLFFFSPQNAEYVRKIQELINDCLEFVQPSSDRSLFRWKPLDAVVVASAHQTLAEVRIRCESKVSRFGRLQNDSN